MRNTTLHSITIWRKGRGVRVEGCVRVSELWLHSRLKLVFCKEAWNEEQYQRCCSNKNNNQFDLACASPLLHHAWLKTSLLCFNSTYTVCLQMNGAVSKVNKKFISLPYTGKTYTVSSGNCPSFSCATSISLARAYCGAAGPVSKMASQQEKAFCVLRFEVSRSVITVKCSSRFRKDAPCMVHLF